MAKVVIKTGFINVPETFLNLGCCKHLAEALKVRCIVTADIHTSHSTEASRILLSLVLAATGAPMRKTQMNARPTGHKLFMNDHLLPLFVSSRDCAHGVLAPS
jgi:hypothetical protein